MTKDDREWRLVDVDCGRFDDTCSNVIIKQTGVG